jgi:hypothetical protein
MESCSKDVRDSLNEYDSASGHYPVGSNISIHHPRAYELPVCPFMSMTPIIHSYLHSSSQYRRGNRCLDQYTSCFSPIESTLINLKLMPRIVDIGSITSMNQHFCVYSEDKRKFRIQLPKCVHRTDLPALFAKGRRVT